MLNAYNPDVIARITLGVAVIILLLTPFYYIVYKSIKKKQNTNKL